MNHARMPFSLGFGGEFVSATSTSPFGNTWSQRGCSSLSAYAATLSPAAAIGVVPAGQPTALATLTTGISDVRGGGSCGLEPIPASTGSRAAPPQAARVATPTTMTRRGSLISNCIDDLNGA